MSSAYADKKVVQTSAYFVNVVGHGNVMHGTTEVPDGRGGKRRVCELYPSIQCQDHRNMFAKAVTQVFKGPFGTPTTVFLDPNGAQLFRVVGSMAAPQLVQKMQEALARVKGEKITVTVWKSAKEQIKEAEGLLGEGEYSDAIKLYQKVARLKPEPLKKLGEAGLEKANEKGNELVKQAQGLIDSGEKRDGRKLLSQVKKEFRGMECAKAAGDLLKSLN